MSGPFDKGRGPLLALGLGVSLLATLVAIVALDQPEQAAESEPTAESRSALGHRAFIELLKANPDWSVRVTTHRAVDRIERGLVLILEPDPSKAQELAETLTRIRTEKDDVRALVVLPKWDGASEPSNPAWLSEIWYLPAADVAQVTDSLNVRGRLRRESAPPSSWDVEEFTTPTLELPQLLDNSSLVPLLSSPAGDLFGCLRYNSPIWVLTDPDILSNQGIGKGENAQLALEIVSELLGDHRTVVIDESFHGEHPEPGLIATLLRFPLVLIPLTCLLLFFTVAWAGLVRFGRVARETEALTPGKSFLIENTASLLLYAGHSGHSLRRYLDATRREIEQRTHAPKGLKPAALDAWIDQLAEHRDLKDRFSELVADVNNLAPEQKKRRRSPVADPGRVLATARKIHRLRQEILHGTSRDQGRH